MLRKIFSKISCLSEQELKNRTLRKLALRGKLPRVRRLLAEGADVDYTDGSKLSPLYFTATDGYVDVARLLLEKSADPDIGNEENMRGTALV